MIRLMTVATTIPLLFACGSKTEPTAVEPPAPPANLFPGFDAKADLARLNGKWRTGSSGEISPTETVWTFKDGAFTEVRGDETSKGVFITEYPGHLDVRTDDNGVIYSRTINYTYNGDTIYLGGGQGGRMIGDVYYAHGFGGATIYDGKTCKYYRREISRVEDPPAFSAPINVACAVTGNIFKFQELGPGPNGTLSDYEVEIVGTALVSSQLKDSTLTRIE